jgi:hypothetical protein
MTPPQATKSQFKSAGKPCGLPVIGWKHPPSGWYPEIPLKDGSVPPSSLARFLARAERQAKQHGYISGEYFANKSGEPKLAKAKKLCLTCRKIKVTGIRRYCEYCFRDRHRAAKRRYWNKRSSLDKTGFSPIGAEALTKPGMQVGYHHPKTSISGSSFSTQQGIAQAGSEAHGTINTAEVA